MERQDIIRELRRLINSKNNDAVKLAFQGGEDAGDIGKMDLRGVVELKRSAHGGVEVKFVDRLKALELLGKLCSGSDDEALDAFIKSLEETQ